MVEINQTSHIIGEVSAAELQKSADQGSSTSAEIDVKGTNTDKKITKNNLDAAAMMPPQKAIEYLIGNSPLGWTKPTTQDLESMGYSKRVPHNWYNPIDYYDSPSGVIEDSNIIIDENGSTILEYKTNDGKYIQKMVYDKEGNLLQGDLISKDLYGDTVDHLTVLVDENGKKSYIR